VVIKNIRIKKPGGGTRMQRVEVLKSGKFKFVKNLKTRAKSAARKVKAKVKRRKTVKKNPAPRRSVPGRKGLAKITSNPTLKKVLIAAGAVSVATSAAAIVAPSLVPTIQKPIVKAILGFLTGDIVGAASNFLLGGGGNFISGNSNGNGGGNNVGFA